MRIIFVLFIFFCEALHAIPHYYCTVADERHYTLLINLIGSIHKNDFDLTDEIAVFDIGLSQEQKTELESIEKVKIYQVEKVHPDLFTYFKTNPAGREVRGWFAWKPVVLKQALDMFPYVLYLDAGNILLNSPDNLFRHIQQNGYFLIADTPIDISERITKPVADWIASTFTPEQHQSILK